MGTHSNSLKLKASYETDRDCTLEESSGDEPIE